MFKEDYIKDNNQIKPDADFLAKLKEKVAEEGRITGQEDDSCGKNPGSVVHIEEAAAYQTVADFKKSKKSRMKWIVVAASVILICVTGIISEGIDFNGNGSLKGNIESIFHKDTEDEDVQAGKDSSIENDQIKPATSEISSDCQKQYEKVIGLFQKLNVVIYETSDFMQKGDGLEYLDEDGKTGKKLDNTERAELVGDILSGKYQVAESREDFTEERYYMAEFEDGSVCRFIIGNENQIYIAGISGIQSVAYVH